MSKPSLRKRLRYRFDNTMSKGTKALIGWLLLVTGLLVLLGGGLVVLAAPPAEGESGFWTTLWTSLLHVLDPGTVSAADTTAVGFVVVMFALTIGGIVIMSSLIGIITTGLDAKLEELRKGRSTVMESGHTVVLGWSDQVFTIIAELVEANESERRARIVILADRDKVEMEDEIRDKISQLRTTKVVCRTGDPTDPDDVSIVSPDEAKSVIMLASGGADADSHMVRGLLAISQRFAGLDDACHVVASVSDSRNHPAAQLAGGPHAQVIDATDVMARLMVQTCRQSGLSVVYTDLLSFDGCELYLVEEPRLVGSSVGQAVHAYRTSAVAGLQRADGSLKINPPARTTINPGDKLLVVAEDDSTVILDGGQPAIDESSIVARGEHGNRPERTLVLGWNARSSTILEQLDAYVSPGSTTDVVAPHPDMPEQIRRLAPRMRVQSVNFKTDDTTSRELLESLNVSGYDHIIALCSDDVEPQLADSRTLVTLLHLRDMAQRAGVRYPVVSEMADDRNRTLAQVTEADDFIVSEKIITLMLTQTSENPHLWNVFSDLFDPDGSEIYLKPCEHYVRPGAAVDFHTVAESALRRGELAIGYRSAALSHEPPSYGVLLNPDKGRRLEFQPGDKVVVLAED